MALHNSRPLRTLALAATISAIAAPGALAIPTEEFKPGSRADSDSLARTVPVRVVHVEPGQQGFDWGDAGIGATGLLALIAIGAGAAVATGHSPRVRHDARVS
jgi:hypothetical protein